MSTTPSDPHGPDSADGTPPVCPRHPGRAAYVRCAVCRRPACLDCQRPGSAAGPVCVDCASGVVAGPAPTVAPAGAAASVPVRRRTGFAASPVTWILLAVTAVVYAAQWLTRDQASGVTEALWYAGLYTSPYGMEPWRMASYALVHDVSGPTHLLLNMLALWVSDPLQPVVGASGAVYGMFAALFLLTRVRGGQVRSIAVLIGLNLVFSFLLPGVAWQVHVGGLLTGAVVAVVFSLAGGLRPRRARVPSVGAQAAGLVVVAAALAALTVLGAARVTVAGLLG